MKTSLSVPKTYAKRHTSFCALSFAGVALVLIAVSGNIHSKLPTRHTKTSSLTQTGGEHAYSGSDTKEPSDAKTATSGVDVGSRHEELSVCGYNVHQILLGGF